MRRLGLALAVAVAVAVAGCGSSGTSDKEYRDKANAICASIKSQRDREAEAPHSSPPLSRCSR